jgi:hypothetical protein
MGYPLKKDDLENNVIDFPYQSQPPRPCWQRLVGINVLNLYYVLEESGRYESAYWLEDIHVNDQVVEVSSLPCAHRDAERIGKVLTITSDSVIIETDDGQRIKWVNGTFLKIPNTIIY